MRSGRPPGLDGTMAERAGVRAATCALVALTALPAASAADPLDRVSGTEDWKRAGPESIQAEWEDWFRARVAWRRARRELRRQRRLNREIAAWLPPARRRPGTVPAPRAARPAVPPPQDDTGDGQPAVDGRGSSRVHVPDQPPDREPDAEPEDRVPEPPAWVRVPVERLDDSGQAIDEEGDRVLRDAAKD